MILLRILVKVTCVVGLYYLFIWLWCYGGWFGFCVWVCGLVQLVGLVCVVWVHVSFSC